MRAKHVVLFQKFFESLPCLFDGLTLLFHILFDRLLVVGSPEFTLLIEVFHGGYKREKLGSQRACNFVQQGLDALKLRGGALDRLRRPRLRL